MTFGCDDQVAAGRLPPSAPLWGPPPPVPSRLPSVQPSDTGALGGCCSVTATGSHLDAWLGSGCARATAVANMLSMVCKCTLLQLLKTRSVCCDRAQAGEVPPWHPRHTAAATAAGTKRGTRGAGRAQPREVAARAQPRVVAQQGQPLEQQGRAWEYGAPSQQEPMPLPLPLSHRHQVGAFGRPV